MRLLTVCRLALLVVLGLLLRKLLWCVCWLWRYYHGQKTPAPISFLPRQSGRVFDEHVRNRRKEGS